MSYCDNEGFQVSANKKHFSDCNHWYHSDFPRAYQCNQLKAIDSAIDAINRIDPTTESGGIMSQCMYKGKPKPSWLGSPSTCDYNKDDCELKYFNDCSLDAWIQEGFSCSGDYINRAENLINNYNNCCKSSKEDPYINQSGFWCSEFN
jgi:hypothetical protein